MVFSVFNITKNFIVILQLIFKLNICVSMNLFLFIGFFIVTVSYFLDS